MSTFHEDQELLNPYLDLSELSLKAAIKAVSKVTIGEIERLETELRAAKLTIKDKDKALSAMNARLSKSKSARIVAEIEERLYYSERAQQGQAETIHMLMMERKKWKAEERLKELGALK
jgi:hypothetical protein